MLRIRRLVAAFALALTAVSLLAKGNLQAEERL
jgi:hypothetical protein